MFLWKSLELKKQSRRFIHKCESNRISFWWKMNLWFILHWRGDYLIVIIEIPLFVQFHPLLEMHFFRVPRNSIHETSGLLVGFFDAWWMMSDGCHPFLKFQNFSLVIRKFGFYLMDWIIGSAVEWFIVWHGSDFDRKCQSNEPDFIGEKWSYQCHCWHWFYWWNKELIVLFCWEGSVPHSDVNGGNHLVACDYPWMRPTFAWFLLQTLIYL